MVVYWLRQPVGDFFIAKVFYTHITLLHINDKQNKFNISNKLFQGCVQIMSKYRPLFMHLLPQKP